MAPSLPFNKDDFTIDSFNKNVYGSMDEYFVTLEIVEQNRNYKKKKGEEETAWSIDMFSKRDMIPGRQTKNGSFIQVEDINPARKKIAVYGSPGTGKTTLCKKIVYDFYANGRMNDLFDEIILIKLRRLNEFEQIDTIDDLVAEYFKFDSKMLNLQNCLFILDGWDEIWDYDVGSESVNVMKVLKTIISDLRYQVILTSRPNANMTHIFRHADQVLEIQGFDEFNARKYIKNVLNLGSHLNSDDEANFLGLLSSVVVSDMMTIPIILDILLFTWEVIKKTTPNSELTMTKLYELMVLRLWTEFLSQKLQDRGKKLCYQNLKSVVGDGGPLYNESLVLSKIARNCFEKGNLLFFCSDIEFDCIGALVKSRFLNAVNANEGNDELKQYEFIHLTICEFFTALNYVLYTTNVLEFREIVTTHKYHVTYKFVFGFISGLISSGIHGFECSNTEMLNIFFDCLESEPYDLIRNYHSLLIVTCLNECADNFEDVGRLTEMCNDLSDKCPNYLGPITSLAVIENFVKLKSKHNYLASNMVCRYPIFTERFLELPEFLALDVASQINVLGSQITFNDASKIKLEKLLHFTNRSEIWKFFSERCSRISDIFLIFIFENFARSQINGYGSDIIDKLKDIKMSLEDAKNVCAYFESTVKHTDSVGEIIKKLVANSDFEIKKIIFLRNVYEFTECSKEVLMSLLFDEHRSVKSIRRIVYAMAIFNVASPDVLTKLMETMRNYVDLRPLIVRVIFYLYENKWLPDDVVIYFVNLTQILNQENRADEEIFYLDIWSPYAELFLSDITATSKMYELVCRGLLFSNFHPNLLNDLICRLCDGKQPLDNILLKFLSTQPLTDDQIENCISSDRIALRWKNQLQAYNKHFKAFCEKNHKNFLNPSPTPVIMLTDLTTLPIRQPVSTLTDLNSKITELHQQHRRFFDLCWQFCSDFGNEIILIELDKEFAKIYQEKEKTFFEELYGVDEFQVKGDERFEKIFERKFFNLCSDIFTTTFLSLNQRGTYIADRLLVSAGNQCAKEIERIMRNIETSNVFQEAEFYQKLTDNMFGQYYFQIIDKGLWSDEVSVEYLIQWISSDNIKCLLTFLIDDITKFNYALYIEPDISSHFRDDYRLCSSRFRSKPLKFEDLNFIYEFCVISKPIDHPCRQVKKNAVSDIYSIDKCSHLFRKIENCKQLREISDKDKTIIEFINAQNFYRKIDFLKIFYDEKTVKNNRQDLITLWKHIYGSGDKDYEDDDDDFEDDDFADDEEGIESILNFGPYHIDLSGANLTDKAIVQVGEPNIEEFLVGHSNNVHILVLSNNHITVDGFERLMRSVVKCNVKHVLLDGNHIYFDENSYSAFESLITDPNLQLSTLDLSSNFIAAQWVDKLKTLSNKNFTNSSTNVKYCLINKCRVIYQRNLINLHKKFTPSIDLITEMTTAAPEPVIIDQQNGCVGAVSQTQYGYSGHALIFIERMINGQREMKTAELLKHREHECKIRIRDVNPFASFKNRLLSYNVPKVASLSNEEIEQLLIRIVDSQKKANFAVYNVSTENKFENIHNCIKWVNDMMEPFVGYKIIKEKIPWFYRTSLNVISVLFFAVIVIAMIIHRVVFR